MYKKMNKIIKIIPLVLLCSCAQIVTYPELLHEAEETYRESLMTSFISELYYIGSDEEFDYFQVIHPPFKEDDYKVLKNESPIKKRFAYKSSKRTIKVREKIEFPFETINLK